MKKRKRFLTAAFIMSICLLFAFSGCDNDTECTHEWQSTSVRTEPTCTAVGGQEQKCTRCGEAQTVEIPVLEHVDENNDHKCDICKNTVSEHIGDAAACTEQATCTVCGEK